MKIHIVNPNTTASMTDKALIAARQVASRDTELIAGQPGYGRPASKVFMMKCLRYRE